MELGQTRRPANGHSAFRAEECGKFGTSRASKFGCISSVICMYIHHNLISKVVSQAKVHAGFLHAYMSIRSILFEKLDPILASPVANARGGTKLRKTKVLVTGHSLGGALATLAAFELSFRYEGECNAQKLSRVLLH